MKTVVKATEINLVVDGWGNEIEVENELVVCETYLGDIRGSENMTCRIIKQLLPQEKIMDDSKEINMLSPWFWDYEKFL